MQLRRCAVLVLQPQEVVTFRVEGLLQGGDGLHRELAWFALAPHLPAPVRICADAMACLGRLSPGAWTETHADALAEAPLATLVAAGLVLVRGQQSEAAARDARLRTTYWHPLAAVMHAFSRWQGVDAVRNMQASDIETAPRMRRTLGAPPPHARDTGGALQRLPRTRPSAFDALLARRVTCRNFQADRPLPLALAAQVLQRTFGSSGRQAEGEDLVFLKKNVPSGGGLHPIEAYLLARNVEGLAPGIYLYRAEAHAVQAVPASPPLDRDLLMEMVAQQHWFADAQALVVLAPRFNRTYWKYRQHAKSYRVVAMEAGHLSQTLYLAATEAGLGAFITAAINEKPIERALGLDTVEEGVLAVCGFGWRAAHMVTSELDPAAMIWHRADGAAE